MGKDCQSCVKEGIGCESVQKMMHEIDELKRAKAHCGFFITFTVLFVLFAGMLIYNTWPQKVKDSVITINVVETKGETTGDEVQISKSALKDTLQQSAYAARREAQNEYDRNFSTLLTILTIFGIAWPLIVAFAQYKFNERELNKIQDTDKKASDALDNANKASDNAQNALTNATEATNNATTALTKASKAADDATSAFANANKAVGDATSALTNANKALEENRQTNDIVQSIFESFTKNNYLNWKAQAVFYKNLEFVIKRTKIGNLAIYNMLKIMSLHCTCVGIGMGHLNVVNADDVKNITNAVLHISPEASPDKCSILSKTVIAFVKEAIETFLKFNQDSKIKQQLSEFLQKITDIHEAYKQLAPENEEEDSKA